MIEGTARDDVISGRGATARSPGDGDDMIEGGRDADRIDGGAGLTLITLDIAFDRGSTIEVRAPDAPLGPDDVIP